jgi:polyphosphate kinase
LIFREIENSKTGGKGKLIFKMNSLVDPALIGSLYEASQNGVEIDLIVRGICCLVPGVPGLSENIRVRSIVGRFLEHSRLFYFYNNGEEEMYLSSADFMQRNLDKRVEIAFPIKDIGLKNELFRDVLRSGLKDNLKARILKPNFDYEILKPNDDKKIDSQEWLMNHTIKIHSKAVKNKI